MSTVQPATEPSQRTANKIAAPQLKLRSRVQYSIAGAIHFFSSRDGICRKFQREIAAHTKHNDATVNRNLGAMAAAGAVMVREPGETNPAKKPIPKGTNFRLMFEISFPSCALITRPSFAGLRPGTCKPGFAPSKNRKRTRERRGTAALLNRRCGSSRSLR